MESEMKKFIKQKVKVTRHQTAKGEAPPWFHGWQ